MKTRTLTQAAHDNLVAQGRIRNGMLEIALPEPGGAKVYEPVRIGLPREQAFDFGPHTGWRHVLVKIPMVFTDGDIRAYLWLLQNQPWNIDQQQWEGVEQFLTPYVQE